MSGPPSPSLIEAYGDARAALAAALERVSLFPEPDILIARLRLEEQDALAWLEGEPFMADHLAINYGFSRRAWRNWPFLFVRAFDRPLPPGPLPTAASIADWLAGPDRTGTGAPADQSLTLAPERLSAWERRTRHLGALPRLIAGADLAASFVRTAPLLAGNPVIGVMLAERYSLPGERLSAGGIIAIGLKQRQTPWLSLAQGTRDDEHDDLSEAAQTERCRIAWLQASATGASSVVRLDKRLRHWLAKLDAACATTRKTSHLREVALLAARGPSLTATRAAQELGLSRQGATQLLAQACERGLLREITHGNAFRRFVPAF